MTSKYKYMRFRWWGSVDLDKVVEEFFGFKIKKIIQEKEDQDFSIYRGLRNEVEVEADTLQAFLSRFKAVLNQKEIKPFTVRDIELREKVLKIYPQNRPTPLPWAFSIEPKFEEEKL